MTYNAPVIELTFMPQITRTMDISKASAPGRLIQLDFFRGVALIIIFINHTPYNDLSLLTPSRFGLSDAADLFVFLSGFASALAYGRCFHQAGLGLGTVRVLHRCTEIYAAHLASFFLLANLCALGTLWSGEIDYIRQLSLTYFFDSTREALIHLFGLHYVPNYFDILPLYFIIMLWIPVIWALSRWHILLALLFPGLLYFAAHHWNWELSADPVSGRPWFFNPFCWQLLFFTGFFFGMGWLPRPCAHRGWIWLTGLTVVLPIPLTFESLYSSTEWLFALHQWLQAGFDKSHFGLLRGIHFLALAYWVSQVVNAHPHWLHGRWQNGIITMGQRSLPLFLLVSALSCVGGMVLDRVGRDVPGLVLVNAGGIAIMLLAARGLAWLNAKPWKQPVTTNGRTGPTAHRPGLWMIPRIVGVSLLLLLALMPLLWVEVQIPPDTVTADVSESLDMLPVSNGDYPVGDEDDIEWQDGV
jgi:hypothetical protein